MNKTGLRPINNLSTYIADISSYLILPSHRFALYARCLFRGDEGCVCSPNRALHLTPSLPHISPSPNPRQPWMSHSAPWHTWSHPVRPFAPQRTGAVDFRFGGAFSRSRHNLISFPFRSISSSFPHPTRPHPPLGCRGADIPAVPRRGMPMPHKTAKGPEGWQKKNGRNARTTCRKKCIFSLAFRPLARALACMNCGWTAHDGMRLQRSVWGAAGVECQRQRQEMAQWQLCSIARVCPQSL